MGPYIVQRLLQSVFVIIGVTLLSFLTIHLDGDPTYLYVSERASQEEIEAIRAKLAFDKPLTEQYFSFISGLMSGDLGMSIRSR